MKVKGSELAEVIRGVVREELKKALPNMIREHLTETYIRKMMREDIADRSGPLSFDNGRDQETPAPKKHGNLGVYDEGESDSLDHNNELRMESNKAINSELLSKKNPMSFLYEDVRPLEDAVVSTAPNTSAMEKAGLDFNKMAILAGTNTAPTSKTMQMDPESKMRDLERRRRALEVPAK